MAVNTCTCSGYRSPVHPFFIVNNSVTPHYMSKQQSHPAIIHHSIITFEYDFISRTMSISNRRTVTSAAPNSPCLDFSVTLMAVTWVTMS